jgi:hypothetical protein
MITGAGSVSARPAPPVEMSDAHTATHPVDEFGLEFKSNEDLYET